MTAPQGSEVTGTPKSTPESGGSGRFTPQRSTKGHRWTTLTGHIAFIYICKGAAIGAAQTHPARNGPYALRQGDIGLYTTVLRRVLLFRAITIAPSPRITTHKGRRAPTGRGPAHRRRLPRSPSHRGGTKGTIAAAYRLPARQGPAQPPWRRYRAERWATGSPRRPAFLRPGPGRAAPRLTGRPPRRGEGRGLR